MKSDLKKKGFYSEGFTFAETLCVLVIGAILTAGVGFSAVTLFEKAKVSAAKEQIASYKNALQSYYLDCGRYPTSQQGLQALWKKPVLYPVSNNWNGPYVDKQIQADPWGYQYVYLTKEDAVYPDEAQGLPFVILSYGSDGNRGGDKDGQDVCSWK